MANNNIKLESLNQLQKLMPRLLEEHGGNKKLMKATIANPILALEEIGFTISSALKIEIEEKVRFSRKQQKERSEIQEKMYGMFGKKIDLSSKEILKKELTRILSADSTNAVKKTIKISGLLKEIEVDPSPKLFQKVDKKDPLHSYKNVHEIVPLLIAYRKLELTAPPLSSKKTFELILQEKALESGITIKNVRLKMQDREKRKANR